MSDMLKLEGLITERRNYLKTDRLDMSFGEIASLYENNEIIISPEYQRTFRRDNYKQTNFIESLLLGMPIPPIFVAEDQDAKWELVDGLQRISTFLSFTGVLKDSNGSTRDSLILTEGGLVKELEGVKHEDMPLKLQLQLKKAICRVEIIKRDSKFDMRYELFNRLNTGGSMLTEQEVRNCIFRGNSNELNKVLEDISSDAAFGNLLSLTDKQTNELYNQELVLRFFALENSTVIETNFQSHLTEYMRKVTTGEIAFDYQNKKNELLEKISYLNINFNKEVFRASNGLFTPNLFDSILQGLNNYRDFYKENVDIFRTKIQELKESEDYKSISKGYSNQRYSDRKSFSVTHFNPNP